MGVSQGYDSAQLAEILGITVAEVNTSAKNGDFPFPAVRVNNRYIFPSKPVDDFLSGKRNRETRITGRTNNSRGKILSKGNHVNLNFLISKPLNEKFDLICQELNRRLDVPLYKRDYLVVAIQEFIDRRPGFLKAALHQEADPEN